jgi:poly(A) polymerase
VRFREDPVRMLRAVALAARLDFTIDGDTAEAVRHLRGEIVRSSSARILEEFYKILRQGRSRRTLEMLHEYGLLAYLLPEADRAIAGGGEALLGSLSRLDTYRQAGLAGPELLTNPLLMGSLLVPLGVPLRRVAASTPRPRRREPREPGEAEPPRDDVPAEVAELGGEEENEDARGDAPQGPLALPFARRDLERLRLVLLAQRRLREGHGPASARRALAGKAYFDEAVRWLEVHGGEDGRELAAQWLGLDAGPVEPAEPGAPEAAAERGREAPRRRRRRRRRRPRPPLAPPA